MKGIGEIKEKEREEKGVCRRMISKTRSTEGADQNH